VPVEILDPNDGSTVPIGYTNKAVLFRGYDCDLISIRSALTTSCNSENNAHQYLSSKFVENM